MNLVDKLLKADTKKADELETGVFKSKRLAKILGMKKETADITIREVKSRRVNDIMAYQVDGKGRMDFSKSFDAKLMMCIEGVVDPDLRNKDLQKHFGVGNAKELAEKIFGIEVTDISDEISRLSGLSDEGNLEEEIKN